MHYKAGIIGCGGIAGYNRNKYCHAEAYQRHPNTELVYAYDTDSKRGIEFRKQWNIPKGDLLEDLDTISICTPDDAHIEWLKQCLALPKVKAVWCEKPICRDYDEAIDIAHKYKEAGKALCVNYQRRWAPKFQILKEEIKSITIAYTGSLWRNGCHGVDLILHLLGSYDTNIAELLNLDLPKFHFEVAINGKTVALNEMYDLYPALEDIINGKELRSDGFSAAETTRVCQCLLS